jgi:hypothetical protein
MRTAPAPARSIFAVLLALLMAVRLLAPAGFMPSFDHGAVTIVACPDAEPGVLAPMNAHHHGHSKIVHQPCPYAAASGVGSLAGETALLLGVLVLAGAALLLGRTFLFVERNRTHERPPLRGPPLPA